MKLSIKTEKNIIYLQNNSISINIANIYKSFRETSRGEWYIEFDESNIKFFDKEKEKLAYKYISNETWFKTRNDAIKALYELIGEKYEN